MDDILLNGLIIGLIIVTAIWLWYWWQETK